MLQERPFALKKGNLLTFFLFLWVMYALLHPDQIGRIQGPH
jgi:hypothetical protein